MYQGDTHGTGFPKTYYTEFCTKMRRHSPIMFNIRHERQTLSAKTYVYLPCLATSILNNWAWEVCSEAEERVVTVQTVIPLEYEPRRKKELSIEHDQL